MLGLLTNGRVNVDEAGRVVEGHDIRVGSRVVLLSILLIDISATTLVLFSVALYAVFFARFAMFAISKSWSNL